VTHVPFLGAKKRAVMTEKLSIETYSAEWPAMFARERARIANRLGTVALRIDHNGSTSVPGLAAKPVIDIQISVRSLAPMDVYKKPLTEIGYTHVPHADDTFCPFFHRPSVWPHTHHVHVVASGGEEERRTLVFRDYLRDHADARAEYERLKRALAAQTAAHDAQARESYANAKTAFIERTIATAIAAGYRAV
jgi:GrpB-like predicted nucleotidyltransferase (UPF0157 family)